MSWFQELQAQAQQLGENLSGQVSKVTSQVVENLQQAQTNLDSEAAQLAAQEARAKGTDEQRLLPWEMIRSEEEGGDVVVVPGLMEKVLALSLEEATFEKEVPSAFAEHFELLAEISVIERLLDLDPNLSAMQARHSASMEEELFWCAYFYQCEQLKIECLADAEYEKVQGPDTAAQAEDEEGVGLAEGGDDVGHGDEDVDDDELEAAIEAELMLDEQAKEAKTTETADGLDDFIDDEDVDEDEISSGEIINAEDEFDDDELEAQIAAELGDELDG